MRYRVILTVDGRREEEVVEQKDASAAIKAAVKRHPTTVVSASPLDLQLDLPEPGEAEPIEGQMEATREELASLTDVEGGGSAEPDPAIPPTKDCPACGGAGRYPDEEECILCEGSGQRPDDGLAEPGDDRDGLDS